jgi:uncharacterized membrane-anchored protein
MVTGLRDHLLRQALTDEIHARPFARLAPPQRVTHLALFSGEGAAAADCERVMALCERFGASPPTADDRHLMVDLGPLQLKWERHTEFSTYTFFQNAGSPSFDPAAAPFAAPVIDLVPPDWLRSLPGDLLIALHLELEPRGSVRREVDDLALLFGSDNFAGSLVSGGGGTVWMDFAIHDDGFGRILVRDRHLKPRQAGRLVQRLCEIETYRTMALLALPAARSYAGKLTRAGERLTELTARLSEITDLPDEQKLLSELTRLSAEVEGIAAAVSYRFGAARAYHALVLRRVEELREERLEGLQTIDEFLERRLAPAMRTCEALTDRLETLSSRIARAGELLRTRVDVALEAQNSDLLRSMDRRAKMQLRLQQTVEGLSVAAISYYLVGLVGYAAKAGKAAGFRIDVDIATGAAIPIVVGLVGWGVWRLRRQVTRAGGGYGD